MTCRSVPKTPAVGSFLTTGGLIAYFVWSALLGISPSVAETPDVDFGAQILPLFETHCLECHGPNRQRGGFRIDQSASVFAEADSGEIPIVAGDAESSEVIHRVIAGDDLRMPPEGPGLSDEEVDLLRVWIDGGAGWPAAADDTQDDGTTRLRVTQADREHWAFRPLKHRGPDLPPSEGDHPLDAFIRLPLAEAGLTPSPQATPAVLLRRMALDVTGLPPGRRQLDRFAAPPQSDAETKALIDTLADELLASEGFGERWARVWLDAVRYADSQGYERDKDEPHAYQYRDFVIRALNDDLPFDDFVCWQLAGDELAPENPEANAATGFLSVGPMATSAPTAPEATLKKIRFDQFDDLVGTTGQAFLGLTLACARCHDHKFDPIPTEDYYEWVSVFANVQRREAPPHPALRELEIWRQWSREALRAELLAAVDCTEDERKWLAAGPAPPSESKAAFKKHGGRIAFTDQQWRRWLSEADRKHLRELEQRARQAIVDAAWQSAAALGAVEPSAEAPPMSVLIRGDVTLPGEPVSFGLLDVLETSRTAEDYLARVRDRVPDSSGRRAALAHWLTDVDQGAGHLAARVIVNRIWQGYFGQGLVRTPNDFGAQGDKPSHPDLLDWLAAELIRGDWRMKRIHRLILTSETYRQSSRYHQRSADVDPQNRLLWRRTPKRLDAEAVRDSILAVSGQLNRNMHGPGIRPFVPESAMATRSRDSWPTDVVEGPKHWRRSVYIFVKRSVRFPMMEAFDAPDPTASCGRRIATTVPVQALTMLNNPSIRRSAKLFADRVRQTCQEGSEVDQAREAVRLALGRPATDREVRQSLEFLQTSDSADPLADLCHALLTLNEFIYVP